MYICVTYTGHLDCLGNRRIFCKVVRINLTKEWLERFTLIHKYNLGTLKYEVIEFTGILMRLNFLSVNCLKNIFLISHIVSNISERTRKKLSI